MQVCSPSEVRDSCNAVLNRVLADAFVTLIPWRHSQDAVLMMLDPGETAEVETNNSVVPFRRYRATMVRAAVARAVAPSAAAQQLLLLFCKGSPPSSRNSSSAWNSAGPGRWPIAVET